jgi:hypothetical protein
MRKAWIVVPTLVAALALPSAGLTAVSGAQHPVGKNAKALKAKAAAAKRAKARAGAARSHGNCPFKDQAALF